MQHFLSFIFTLIQIDYSCYSEISPKTRIIKMIDRKKLREYQYEHRMTIGQLAEELGVHRITLSRVINNEDIDASPCLSYQINKLLSKSGDVVMNKSKSHKHNQDSV
jgi:predicted transcriptional regulator